MVVAHWRKWGRGCMKNVGNIQIRQAIAFAIHLSSHKCDLVAKALFKRYGKVKINTIDLGS